MIGVFVFVLNAFAEPKSLTIDQSIRSALNNSTSVLKSQADREVSGTDLLQSYFQFLPNLTATGNYSANQGTTLYTTTTPTLVHGSNYGPSYQVATTLNIFNGLNDIASFRSAINKRDAAENSLQRAKQQISLDVAQAFLQVILDQKLILIAEKNLKVSQDRERLLSEQTKVGIRNLSDLFRQQAQTSADETFAIDSQNKQKTDLIALLRRLRIDPSEDYNLVEPPLETEVEKAKLALTKISDQKTLIAEALNHRRDYQAARSTSQGLKWDTVAARSSWFPKLDFLATYGANARWIDSLNINGANVPLGSQEPLDNQLRHQTNSTYGMVLTWNIFDRYLTGSKIAHARAQAQKSEIDFLDSHHQVVGEVKQTVNDLEAAIQKMISANKGVIAARKAYEVSQGRYEVGSFNFLDLAIAQSALVSAEAAYAQALITYELEKRTLDFALGTTAINY